MCQNSASVKLARYQVQHVRCSHSFLLQVLAEKRSLGSRDGPPHLVAVIPLHGGISAQGALRLIRSDEAASVFNSDESGESFGLVSSRFKRRFYFIRVNAGERLHGPVLGGFVSGADGATIVAMGRQQMRPRIRNQAATACSTHRVRTGTGSSLRAVCTWNEHGHHPYYQAIYSGSHCD